MKTFVIVNPNSAGGATMKRWPRTSEKMERTIGPFDYEFTKAEGEATLLAGEAVKDGYKKIIAVGGDGTLHEVVQGLFDGESLIDEDILLGTLPSGTGTDFAKTLKIPKDDEEAICRLRGERSMKIDIGLVTLNDHNGNQIQRYLLNMADVGLGGEVAERVNSTPKVFGGLATYLFSSVISFASYKPKKVKIITDGKEFEDEVTSVFVANGQYFGGGMWIAPPAELDDGFLNVIVLGKLSKWDIFSITPRLYSGKLLTILGVKHLQAKVLRVESDEDVLVNIDGEQPGTTPVEFKVLPRVLKFKV